MPSTWDRFASNLEPAPSPPVLPSDNRRWYAIHTHSKFENVVSAGLRGKGYDEFLSSLPFQASLVRSRRGTRPSPFSGIRLLPARPSRPLTPV